MSTGKKLRSLVIAANVVIFAVIVGSLYVLSSVLIPLVLAVVLAFVLTPLVVKLQSWRLGRVSAVVVTIGLTVALLSGLIAVVGLQLTSLANDLPKYRDNIRSKIAALRAQGTGGALDRIRAEFDDVAEERPEPGRVRTITAPVPARLVTDDGLLATAFGPLRAVQPAVEVMVKGLLALILTIFMLIRREDLRNRLVSFMSQGSVTTTTKALDEAGRRISQYMLMQLIVNGVFGFAVGVGLFLIGVPYAFLWGLCAAVLRYVPYVGAWMAAVAPLSIAFVTMPGWRALLLVFSLFLFLELITGNVLEPRIYGKGTGVSEVALLVAATFWAWVWGPVGLILATPLTVCLVVAGKYVPPLAFFDRLLGDRPALTPAVAFLQRLLARDSVEAATVVREYCVAAPPESAYDQLFVPALALAGHERANGAMNADDEGFVLQQTSVIMEGVVRPASQPASAGTRILGLPAHHQADELTLRMLARLLEPSDVQIDVISTRTVPSAMIEQVARERPSLVIIAALPPGGTTQATFLCTALRAALPEIGIIVGCWGVEASLDELIGDLRAAGASYVTTTLMGAQSHVLAMVGVAGFDVRQEGPALAAESTR